MKKLALVLLPLLVVGCTSTVKIEKKLTYKCGNQMIHTTFFDDNSLKLVIDNTSYMLNQNVAASGAKYENMKYSITFWNKGDSNFLQIGTKGYPDCKEVVQ